MVQLNLTPKLLAKRWSLKTTTLRQWRWKDKGPPHFKIGGRVLYRLEDIEKFEKEALKHHTTAAESTAINLS